MSTLPELQHYHSAGMKGAYGFPLCPTATLLNSAPDETVVVMSPSSKGSAAGTAVADVLGFSADSFIRSIRAAHSANALSKTRRADSEDLKLKAVIC